jgi:hypothetical protein
MSDVHEANDRMRGVTFAPGTAGTWRHFTRPDPAPLPLMLIALSSGGFAQ